MQQSDKFAPNPFGSKQKPQINNNNKQQLLESLRGLGGGTVSSLTKDVGGEIGRDFFRQLLNLPEQKATGNLGPGETLEMADIFSGQIEQKQKLQKQLILERKMRAEEQRLSASKTQELRLQLSALTSEVSSLAKTTQGLSQEVKMASMQAPVEPGTYHVIFFEKLLSFIHDFRKNIEDASFWLAAYNARAKKRAHTFFGQVGISGAKRLLSAEDYSQRAAA